MERITGKMKQAVLKAPCVVEMEEAPIPEITEEQVLLKMLCFGICGSDMQIYHGKHKSAIMPLVMGHEGAAVVVQAGSKVNGFRQGDQVTIEPQLMCGNCEPCRRGRFNVCEDLKVIGVHVDGLNREYCAVDPSVLHHIPADMDEELAALVEPLAVAVGSAKRSGRVKDGNVLVVGAGTIGNLTIQAVKALGAKRVAAADINDARLDYALECGADAVINTENTPLKEAVERIFGHAKADVIIDCAAIPSVFYSILEAARPDSDIVITGNYKEPVTFDLPLIQRREINLLGHMMYVRDEFEEAIRLLYENQIVLTKTISQRYPFDRYPEALRFADENPGEVMKILVKFDA